MPRGVYERKPAPGGAVTKSKTPPPAPAPVAPAPPGVSQVRDQVKQMSGYDNLEQLKTAVPESTASTTGEVIPPKKRKSPSTVEVDPLMNDPKYKTAIGNMTAFGGKKVVASGFATAASALKDEKFKLNAEEEQVWDEYFYVLSKRSNFDPTSPWFLAVYALVMILTQIGSRMWERSGYQGLFNLFDKMTPKQPNKNPRPAVPPPGPMPTEGAA